MKKILLGAALAAMTLGTANAAKLTDNLHYTTWGDSAFIGDYVNTNKRKGFGATLHVDKDGWLSQIHVGTYRDNNDHKSGYRDYRDGTWSRGEFCKNGESYLKKGVRQWEDGTTFVGSISCTTDKYTGTYLYTDGSINEIVNGVWK